MKDQLIFDVTDANTIADSDSVGAYVRAGTDGTQIGHTGDALHVNLQNASIVVTATDLDIRDLAFATDSVTAHQGGTWDVNISDDKDYGTVGADTLRTAAQIGNATGAADFGSGTTSAQTLRVALATDTSISTSDAALADTSIANAVNTLAAAGTAEDVVASPLASRKYLFVYNNDNRRMFIGASGVSAADGFPLAPRSYLELRAGASIDIEWVSPKTGHDIRTLELS